MQNNRFDKIFKGATVLLPEKTVPADIAVTGGRIAAIGDSAGWTAAEIIACANFHILPGVIDTQVHFREPGNTHKEDLATGTMAAAAGGVTAIFEMPNTNPLTVTPEAMADKMARAKGRAFTDYAFYFGGTAENAGQLPEWENLPGVCGVKIFMGSSTGSLLSARDEEVDAILRNGRRIVAVHAEDEMIMAENKKTILGGSNDVALHPAWRSVESSLSAVTRLVNLARKYKRRVHVLHVTSAEEIEFLAKNRDIATMEVLPNHLTLCAPECYERLGTKAQQNPPIREKSHRDALWKAVNDGLIDMLASDHAPHTLEEKAQAYPASPSGTPGVQTLVPIMLNHVHEGRLSLRRFSDMVSAAPRRIHGVRHKGAIITGADADFTIVDLKSQRVITNSQQKTRCGWTPYDGLKVTGWPVMTVLRGQIIMREGDVALQPAGQPMSFEGI